MVLSAPHFMSTTESHPDAARSQLRALVAIVESDISRLPNQDTSADGKNATNELRASWIGLVKLLALGDEPELRDCPECGRAGMRDASVCGYCWAKITPFAKPAIKRASSAE
jgi:hypothetical protein